VKHAAPPIMLLRGMRWGNIGNFWSQAGKKGCAGVPISHPGVQFVYGGLDLHFKAFAIKYSFLSVISVV